MAGMATDPAADRSTIAQPLLGKLYTLGSLETDVHGFRFVVKNRLFAATLTAVDRLSMDGVEVELAEVTLVGEGGAVRADGLGTGIVFPLLAELTVIVAGPQLSEGPHQLEVAFQADPFGDLVFGAHDVVVAPQAMHPSVPRDAVDDQSTDAVEARREFMARRTQAAPVHLFRASFDAHETRGNVENFIGVAQVPVGLAGPIVIDGEHARVSSSSRSRPPRARSSRPTAGG
jgi:hydroxymethylglutaryl-CoA reductase (NADPH)